MRIVLPIADRHVATVFDFANTLMVADVKAAEIQKQQKIALPESLPSITVGKLRELQADTLICGAISNPLAAMVWHSGIEVVPGITGEVDSVLRAFLDGQLVRPQYLLPGARPEGKAESWKGHGRRFRGGREQHQMFLRTRKG
jgi:predicted Fe-Mo cluster-binding NifX family protein